MKIIGCYETLPSRVKNPFEKLFLGLVTFLKANLDGEFEIPAFKTLFNLAYNRKKTCEQIT